MNEPLLTPKDVAEILQVSVDTARNEMRKMNHHEIGGPKNCMIRVSRAALDDYLRVLPSLKTFREYKQKRREEPQKTEGRLIPYKRP